MNREQTIVQRIKKLNAIGIALSSEKNTGKLLEGILLEAKTLTAADGGTLYLINEREEIEFQIMRNDSLLLSMGGSHGFGLSFAPIPLILENGQRNDAMVVAYCVNHAQTVNIADAYEAQGFDFSGTRAFDSQTGYRSMSFLTVPLRNHDGSIIGVLQLINKKSAELKQTVAFDADDQELVESLASQAAVALTNKRLNDELQQLFEAFIKLIATAIDDKSPYTGGHCRRVPVVTMMLADAVSNTSSGQYADYKLSEEDRYALDIAAWLHDCGKVTTPEYIVDKATKLETIYDRIGLIDTRFEVLKRDAEIRKLRQVNSLLQSGKATPARMDKLEERYVSELMSIFDDRRFLHDCNIGGEFMDETQQQRVREIATRRWVDPSGDNTPFLSEDEVHNLSISRGTLTGEERNVINHHIVATIKMLEALPFPKHLKNVPEFAGGHHERMDGKGYPRGLTGEQMSVPARIMAIADIFEALTAHDRPYKQAKTLSETLEILNSMANQGHIDSELLEIFVREKVHLQYAKAYLSRTQIDISEEMPESGNSTQKCA